MEIDFLKMQGCGEDGVVLDGSRLGHEGRSRLPLVAERMLERSHGVGGRWLIVLDRGSEPTVRCWAPNGVETDLPCSAACCAARYASDSGIVSTDPFSMRASPGPLRAQVIDSANVRVDLGRPFGPERQAQILESARGAFTRSLLVEGRQVTYTPISLGRSYAMVFVPQFSFPVRGTARAISQADDFPEETGIGFVQVCSRERLRLRVWEPDRGDPADTGQCAAAALVASVVNGFTEREAFVQVPNGEAFLQWEEADNHIRLTGPASYVFTGTYDFEPPSEE
jgi:diaminopimelate epimerase